MRDWHVRVVERSQNSVGTWITVDVFNVKVLAKNKATARKLVGKKRMPPQFVLGKVWKVKAA